MPTLSYATHDAIIAYWNGLGLKVGLLTTAPPADGSSASEPSSSAGYARQPMTLESVARGTGGEVGYSIVKNSNAMVFGPCVTTDWTAVTYVGLYSADGTKLLAYSPLPASRACKVGDSISFGIEALQFKFR